MSDALSFAEIDEQQVELLPERTIMSTIFISQIDLGDAATECVGGVFSNDLNECVPLVDTAANTIKTGLGQ